MLLGEQTHDGIGSLFGIGVKRRIYAIDSKNIQFAEKKPIFYAAQVILGTLSDYWSTANFTYEENAHFSSVSKLSGL